MNKSSFRLLLHLFLLANITFSSYLQLHKGKTFKLKSMLSAFSFYFLVVFIFCEHNTVVQMSLITQALQSKPWEDFRTDVFATRTGAYLKEQEQLRAVGEGLPHTDAKIQLFGTKDEPRVTYYRDTAAWCPYCQVRNESFQLVESFIK